MSHIEHHIEDIEELLSPWDGMWIGVQKSDKGWTWLNGKKIEKINKDDENEVKLSSILKEIRGVETCYFYLRDVENSVMTDYKDVWKFRWTPMACSRVNGYLCEFKGE